MIKDIPITSTLSLREVEVLSEQLSALQAHESYHLRFFLEKGFLPRISWLDRFRSLIAPLIEQKKSVEIVVQTAQDQSLRRAGFHLICDMTLSGAPA